MSFGYRTGREIVHDFSLPIPAGQTVALLGSTGAGKSTLARLLARFYDPSAGVVSIDGIALPDLAETDLRRAVAMVTQESFMFSGSVADNIAFGRPDATRAEIEAAGRAVGVDAVVSHLRDGYDESVGKNGARLSAGQRQLIALARALLADPAVLILDEASSSLDAPTERLVQRALRTVLADRTALIIAHRLSTVAHRRSGAGDGRRPDHRGRRRRPTCSRRARGVRRARRRPGGRAWSERPRRRPDGSRPFASVTAGSGMISASSQVQVCDGTARAAARLVRYGLHRSRGPLRRPGAHPRHPRARRGAGAVERGHRHGRRVRRPCCATSLHIDNADIGLLVAVNALVAAIASLPFGVLADRFRRTTDPRAVDRAVGRLHAVERDRADSFGDLLLTRLFLGIATAVAGPVVASMLGDWFASAERGRIYSYVLTGELLGAGVGFAVTGDIAALSWRLAFVILAVAGLRVAVVGAQAAGAGTRRRRRDPPGRAADPVVASGRRRWRARTWRRTQELEETDAQRVSREKGCGTRHAEVLIGDARPAEPVRGDPLHPVDPDQRRHDRSPARAATSTSPGSRRSEPSWCTSSTASTRRSPTC